MANYNLKQIFESEVDISRQPARVASATRYQAPEFFGDKCRRKLPSQRSFLMEIHKSSVRDDIKSLYSKDIHKLLTLGTKTVTHVVGLTRINKSNPSTFRRTNQGLFVSFPHFEKQKEPVVQKIKRT